MGTRIVPLHSNKRIITPQGVKHFNATSKIHDSNWPPINLSTTTVQSNKRVSGLQIDVNYLRLPRTNHLEMLQNNISKFYLATVMNCNLYICYSGRKKIFFFFNRYFKPGNGKGDSTTERVPQIHTT